MTPLRKRYLILAIIIVGLFLRLYGIGFGLPYQFHQDEPIVVNHALAYGTGDLNPHFFNIPPLTSYILFFFYGILFVLGKLSGAWQDSAGYALRFFSDPSLFYITGRMLIGVIPGTACIFLTYRLAGRFLSEKAALYSAAVMAFSFLNVVNSHFIYTDMILVMLILLFYERLYSLFTEPVIKNYCLVGVLIGLATGTKYNGAVLVIPYLLAHVMALKAPRKGLLFSAGLWLGFVSAAAAFIAVNPFAILDYSGFSVSFLSQSGAFWYTGWAHHIAYSLFEGVSVPIAIKGIAGLVLMWLNGKKWNKAVVIFPVVLYLLMVFKSQHFSRYVLPVVPFVAMGSGYLFFDRIASRPGLKRAGSLITVVALIFLVPTAVKAVKADMLLSSLDTRISAAEWIENSLPKGTKIACDDTTFRPAISQPYSQLEEKKLFLEKQEGLENAKSRKLDMTMRVSKDKGPGYPVYFIAINPEAQGKFLNSIPAVPYDVSSIKRQGIEYIVINNQLSNPEKEEFLKELEKRAEVVKDFSPYADGVYRETFDPTATTCIAVTDEDVFSRKTSGPALRIYRIKE